jgi:hypothetical protein
VDWSKLATMPWYVKAVGNTRIVGPHVANTLRWLESIGAFNLRRVHVVGFSLGAEVAGFMGKALFPQRVIFAGFITAFMILMMRDLISSLQNYVPIHLLVQSVQPIFVIFINSTKQRLFG